MAKYKIFISFDYDHDRNYRDLLRAWDANQNFQFTVNETSPRVAVDSVDAAAIKRTLSAKINEATRLLCIVGEYTHKSGWVKWEINKAKEFNKKLIAVKIKKEYETPAPLIGAGATWAMSFTQAAILKAISDS